MSSLSAAAASVHNAQAEAPSAPPRVLIVDDVADNRAVLSCRFVSHDFEVVEADCGAEALRLVQEQTFDVMLLDVMLPDMNGTEVLGRIREKFFYLPDLEQPRPPDLPPGLMRLRIVVRND